MTIADALRDPRVRSGEMVADVAATVDANRFQLRVSYSGVVESRWQNSAGRWAPWFERFLASDLDRPCELIPADGETP